MNLEPDELGMQFFQNGTAQGTEESFDVVAYNVYNNDALESDNDRPSEATLGAFDEANFWDAESHRMLPSKIIFL